MAGQKQPQPQAEAKTLEITNFGGRLTRILNGDLNSGFAKFVQSWGYDPFSKPMNLTWFEKPTDISSGVSDLIVVLKPWFQQSGLQQYIFGLGSSGNLYQIETNTITSPNFDSIIGVTSIANSSPSFNFGGSIEFFGSAGKMYIGADSQVNVGPLPPTGAADALVGVKNTYIQNRFRPLKQFAGKLAFGNGNTIGVIDSTGTVTSSVIGTGQGNTYSELNPPLPREANVTDLDTSTDGNYLLITASGIGNENIATVSNDRQAAASSDGTIYKWNGSDKTITSFNSIPSYAVTALQVYLQNNVFFSDDTFGASMSDGINKVLTLPGNKSPFANSTLVNGNFISWMSPEISSDGTHMNASLYYFGSLDAENPKGLYRLLRYSSTLANGFIYQVPANILTNNKYLTVNNGITAVVPLSYGKHYFSTFEVNSTNFVPNATTCKLYSFLVTPTGSGTAQLGVYETQNQLFSKRIGISQIRVYTEPTVTGNGFQLDLIGGDGAVIDNGTFNYSFGSITDPNTSSNSMERINFNPGTKTLFSLGLRITNTGTTNMTIKKIEIDYMESGK